MKNPSVLTRVSGRSIALEGDDIDTDRIIPARFMRCVTFDGLGAYAFYDERFDEEGQPKMHPLNAAGAEGARILLVGRNFGCGSSREHAPQALAKFGVKAIVGESFADIFAGNCASIGIPAVSVRPDIARAVRNAAAAEPGAEIVIDLGTMTVAFFGAAAVFTAPVTMHESRRANFLAGTWDTTGSLLANADAAAATAARLPYCSGFA